MHACILDYLCGGALGRRVHETNCLIIATYRDDELSPDHPLRMTLGRLAAPYIQRVKLQPLSEQAVHTLAQQHNHVGKSLYQLTGGNPFYLLEILTNNSDDLPASVADVVMARFTQQPSDVRQILELASLVPKERFEHWLLKAIWDTPLDTVEACAASGLAYLNGDALVFKHDLARQAIANSLPSIRRKMLHILALQGLIECHEQGIQVGFTHIIHHAQAAGDKKAILKYAPLAAQEAINLGAHAQAAAHYRAMLGHMQELEAVEQARIFQALAYECYLTGQLQDAVHYANSAVKIWRQQKRRVKEGELLRWLSRYNWFLGERGRAEEYADQAIAVLEESEPHTELAMAYSNRAQLHMLKNETEPAITYGEKAIKLAEKFDAVEILVHALNNVGTARCNAGNKEGLKSLQRSLELALEHRLEEHAARAYTNITSRAVTERDYDLAAHYFEAGLAYCEQHDLDSWTLYISGWLARMHFEQGDWQKAYDQAHHILNTPNCPAAIRQPAILALAKVAVRRGDGNIDDLLSEAWHLAMQMNEIERIVPTLAAQAEMAWLEGNINLVTRDLRNYYEQTLQQRSIWNVGTLAFWLWRAGELDQVPEQAAQPYLLQMQGLWQEAADAWEEIGCPFERAMALADGDEIAQKTALAVFEDLGAEPAAHWLREKMHAAGIRGLPRGPRQETQENPGNLTSRQMEVLALLVAGLSDSEIAERLYISPKTAGHHVSAILTKLDVRSRQEAAVLAVQRGWVVVPDVEDAD